MEIDRNWVFVFLQTEDILLRSIHYETQLLRKFSKSQNRQVRIVKSAEWYFLDSKSNEVKRVLLHRYSL